MADEPLKIPLPVFKKMLHNLPLEELKKLPPQSLPREVPNDILRQLDEDRRKIVDDLMFEVNSYHIQTRLDIEQKFGEALLPALTQADKPFAEIVRPAFVNQVQEYFDSVQRHTQYADGALLDDIARMEDTIVPQTKALAQLRHKISDYKHLLVERLNSVGEEQSQFEEAIDLLKKQEQLLDVWLGKYFSAKLEKISYETNKYKNILQKNQALGGDVDAQIAAIQKRIDVSIKAMGLKPSEVNTHHFIQSLRSDINELQERRGVQKLLVPESALIDLLDSLVDAALSLAITAKLRGIFDNTKLVLFDLIKLYCGEQSNVVEEAIGDQFSIASHAGATEFSLNTEHFLLQYFTKKTTHLSNNKANPEQLDMLSEIEKELLHWVRG